MITIPLVIGWFVAAAGGIASLVAIFKIGPERRKIAADVESAGADAAKKLSESAVALLAPSVEQVGFLRTELAVTRAENTALSNQIAVLRAEIAALRAELANA